ncbi:hypothetical protein R3P38DRAFT_3374591 [Favolaschia claudopus]|uniref:DUF6570 domain-containing protein n=1 Tax=Favolaschia claudopus TaxID=2862362 RepID=A0AAV9ZMM3_9AGAR
MQLEAHSSFIISTGTDIEISLLTVNEIRAITLSYITLPRELGRNSPAHSQQWFGRIVASLKKQQPSKKKLKRVQLQGQKRKRSGDTQSSRRVARETDSDVVEPNTCDKFLQIPNTEETKRIYRAYYEATSNAAIAMMVCGVCAREIDAGTGTNEDATPRRLEALPNSQCLVPRLAHPAHDLFDGKLLEPAGVVREGNVTKVRVCRECSESLIKSGDHPPKHALANNLWIGRTPWQLQILTFPEQLLIALLYPRVYVFKLHPRCPGRKDPSTLQRGMRGTVSTYNLDSDGIASMLAGDLMPRPPAVFGFSHFRSHTLGSVNCRRTAAKHVSKSDGYTVDHDLAAGAATLSNQMNAPDVIPLQVTGTVDTDLSKLTTNEMMAWGLQNLWKEGKEGGYAIRHGRHPGRGGPEADQPVTLKFADHIPWPYGLFATMTVDSGATKHIHSSSSEYPSVVKL